VCAIMSDYVCMCKSCVLDVRETFLYLTKNCYNPEVVDNGQTVMRHDAASRPGAGVTWGVHVRTWRANAS
jgi:hypothetical protein